MKILQEINKVFKAPEKVVKDTNKSIFLAGSIEMNKAVKWQDALTKSLMDEFDDLTILNPRRDDWDSSWTQELSNKNFYEQVDWEHENIKNSDIVFIYFQKDTKSPISLLELGLSAGLGKTCIVFCEEGFWRKGNVDYICKKYNLPQINSFKDLNKLLKKQGVK